MVILKKVEKWEENHINFIKILHGFKKRFDNFDDNYKIYIKLKTEFSKFLRKQIQQKIDIKLDEADYWKNIDQWLIENDEKKLEKFHAEFLKDDRLKSINGIKDFLDYFWMLPSLKFKFLDEMKIINFKINPERKPLLDETSKDDNFKNLVNLVEVVLLIENIYAVLHEKLIARQIDKLKHFILKNISSIMADLKQEKDEFESDKNKVICGRWGFIAKQIKDLKSEKWQFFGSSKIKNYYFESVERKEIIELMAINIFFQAPLEGLENPSTYIDKIDNCLLITADEKAKRKSALDEAKEKLKKELEEGKSVATPALLEMPKHRTTKGKEHRHPSRDRKPSTVLSTASSMTEGLITTTSTVPEGSTTTTSTSMSNLNVSVDTAIITSTENVSGENLTTLAGSSSSPSITTQTIFKSHEKLSQSSSQISKESSEEEEKGKTWHGPLNPH